MMTGEIYRRLEENKNRRDVKLVIKQTKDHLMLDKVTLKDCKHQKRRLAMGWIDH